MAGVRASTSNMGVDFVVLFRYDVNDKPQAQRRLEELLHRLAGIGLGTEVRRGNNHSILVFTRVARDEHLNAEIYRSRARDWTYGVRASKPAKDTRAALQQEPLTEAERLRIIHSLITNPTSEGGAGITPKEGEWKNVESIFALHDPAYNKEWITKWSTQSLLTQEDIDEIRDRLGEKIAFYFAFTQSYFVFLTVPAAFGTLTWLFLGHFSPWYAVVAVLWTIGFVEWWQHQERDLAVRWNVRGVGSIERPRTDFRPKYTTVDEVTGEKVGVFPHQDRFVRQLLQIPFVIAAVLVLGTMIATCFAIEIFISEVYSGPGKSLLTFLPTVLLTTGLPFLTGILGDVADRLTNFENYETDSQHNRAATSKHFILSFITSYLPLSLTAFVYVPFGNIIVPYLDVFGLAALSAVDGENSNISKTRATFSVNPERLRKQVIYFAITAQIVNFAMEIAVPYLKRQGFIKMKEMKSKRSTGSSANTDVAAEDSAEEKEFLKRVRNEAELGVYEVYDDIREMVIQYGYLALFSVIWPLVPVSYLINNWVELRSDAVKICIEMQRPTPARADTIGPWLDALSFLSWLGSITMAALTYMFMNDGLENSGVPSNIRGWALLLSIFLSEHLYLGVRWAVATAISKIDSPGRLKAKREIYRTRQKILADSLDSVKNIPPINDKAPAITRKSLEDDARTSSLKATTPEEHFWARQRGWEESAQVGRALIEKDVGEVKSSEQKKEL